MKDIKMVDDLDYRETDVSLEYLINDEVEDNIDLEDTKDYSQIFNEEDKNGVKWKKKKNR